MLGKLFRVIVFIAVIILCINTYQLNQQLALLTGLKNETQPQQHDDISKQAELLKFALSRAKYDEQTLRRLIEQTIQKSIAQWEVQLEQHLALPKTEVASVSEQQFTDRMEIINGITAQGYLDHDSVRILQDQMDSMSKEQIEQVLSKVFRAMNEGRLELAPGVVL